MKNVLILTVIISVLGLGESYSKYGRTCKDIGCTSKQVCVIVEDPCTTYSRPTECGKYPTCKTVSNAASTCATYDCPPTKKCKMDGGVPKCFDDPDAALNRNNKQTVQSYNPGAPIGESPSAPVMPPGHPQANYPSYPQNPAYPQNPYPQNPGSNPNYPQNPAYNPNYPQNPAVYPQIPVVSGGTTPRPNVYQPGHHVSGGGYTGGAVGSGYPGQGSYPQAGYPAQGGGNYPNQNFPGGYPVQGGGYSGGYPVQGGGNYPNQGGGSYPKQGQNYNQNRYGQKSGSDSILDKVTDALKTIGLFWFFVKFITSRAYSMYC